MDSTSPYTQLDTIVVKLKRLLHLKDTYNFVSSYEAYQVGLLVHSLPLILPPL